MTVINPRASRQAACGLHARPVRPGDVSLAVIQARTLFVFHVLVYKYAALRFTTRSSVGVKIASLVTLIACRRLSTVRSRHRSS